MSIVYGVLLGIAINVAIVVVIKTMSGKRQKMSYTDYLDLYGRSEGYTSDDVYKFMGDDYEED
jgi:hypothetical protein